MQVQAGFLPAKGAAKHTHHWVLHYSALRAPRRKELQALLPWLSIGNFQLPIHIHYAASKLRASARHEMVQYETVATFFCSGGGKKS
jgi:hypothetical protein